MIVPRLIYVDRPWAWFTTREDWQHQWGDDWDDAPYNCNAGDPYEWRTFREVPEYTLSKIAFDCELETPAEREYNSRYSVQMINSGMIAWLATYEGSSLMYKQDGAIHAGVTTKEFAMLIHRAGGTAYYPRLQPVA